jgi:uncharacterized protein HemY
MEIYDMMAVLFISITRLPFYTIRFLKAKRKQRGSVSEIHASFNHQVGQQQSSERLILKWAQASLSSSLKN